LCPAYPQDLHSTPIRPSANNGSVGSEITEADIQKYLDDRDDFDLELFAFRTLKANGWFAELGGTYVDPVLGKPRQYDVRARIRFSQGIERELYLAVECKSLTKENPLVVSCVPRPIRESLHDVIIRRIRREMATRFSK